MSPSKCNYHPNMQGIYRCPTCNKDICTQCKTVYGEISKSEGTQTIIEHQKCPVCYWEHRISEINKKVSTILKKYLSIYLSVMLVVFDIVISYLIFIYFSQNNTYTPAYFFFLPILSIQIAFGIGLMLLLRMRKEPSQIKSLKNQKKKFLERSFALKNYLMQNM